MGLKLITDPEKSVRLDRWLSAARFYKTRTQAAKACEGRKVKVNGSTAKSHKAVHIGDEIVVHHRGRYRTLTVNALADRGIPPVMAREMYSEREAPPRTPEEEEMIALYRQMEKKQRLKYKGRPTKKERRKLLQIRRRPS
jgi:ribosome-associated heat shock protein Hsp15